MPRRKNPDYETREMLLERCNRQRRSLRLLQAQRDLATRALSRVIELATIANGEIARLSSLLTDTQKGEDANAN